MGDVTSMRRRVDTESILETLILWDVDHTLIENGGVSKKTYLLAFERITGTSSLVRPQTDGRTDLQVMRKLFADNPPLALHGTSDSEIEDALADAIHEVTPTISECGYALPGAEAILRRLSEVDPVTQSVLTGNIRRNAEVKLSAFNLDRFLDLDVGGYGSDHVDRARLVDIAREKALEKYSIHFDRSSTLIVGDTVRDVQTAQRGGAKILAVASGVTSESDLLEEGADIVLPDLSDSSKVLTALAELRMQN